MSNSALRTVSLGNSLCWLTFSKSGIHRWLNERGHQRGQATARCQWRPCSQSVEDGHYPPLYSSGPWFDQRFYRQKNMCWLWGEATWSQNKQNKPRLVVMVMVVRNRNLPCAQDSPRFIDVVNMGFDWYRLRWGLAEHGEHDSFTW